jgi:hypothetical protein
MTAPAIPLDGFCNPIARVVPLTNYGEGRETPSDLAGRLVSTEISG